MSNDINIASHNKRYGQYFSGRLVSELLVSLLPDIEGIDNAIDPMVGKGDMLLALKRAGVSEKCLYGIEIDKEVAIQCSKLLDEANIEYGDAFIKCKTKLNGAGEWDLVITNPPYIRYQLLNSENKAGVLPNAQQIRNNLVSHIVSIQNLNNSDKELFLKLAEGYSGLSDIAVPSWILCASIVKPNGYLAMVVPETWMNRDYASPIQYMLIKCFDIMIIAKDIGAVWFDNALVRTCLVVAQRKVTVSMLEIKQKETYILDLGQGLIGDNSLVENFKFNSYISYEAIKNLIRSGQTIKSDNIFARKEKSYSLFPNLIKNIEESKWALDEDIIQLEEFEVLPSELKELLKDSIGIEFQTLSEMGVQTGQGLRTGANDFFYGTVLENRGETVIVQSRSWYGKIFEVYKRNIVMTLQNRGEISGLCAEENNLRTCLFYIQNEIRNIDVPKINPELLNSSHVMNEALEDYITEGEVYVPIKGKTTKPFQQLSAVLPNVKKDKEGYRRFWYMLPMLTKRHVPNLCIPRVCGKSIECIYINQNEQQSLAVDANFNTLWCNEKSQILMMFALLNSSWTKCYLELISTVMGGGALKVEASHLKKVLFPRYNKMQREQLALYGKKICEEKDINNKLQKQIDKIVIEPFENENNTNLDAKIIEILKRKLRERGASDDRYCTD